MDEERKLWDQMEQEPDLWYGRFRAYMLMGFKRSVNAVFGRETKKNQEKTRTNAGPEWYESAKKWEWEKRAKAYDIEQENAKREKEEKQREEDLKAIREMLLRHIQAEVEASSVSQIQAAKILHEYYIMTGDIAQLRSELQALCDKMRSWEGEQ